MHGLSHKEIKFCQLYVEYGGNGNGGQAARDVGYAESGARTRAYEILNKLDAQLYIAQLELERAESQRADRNRVILEMKRLALYDPRNLYRADGTLKDPHELDDETAAALEQIEVNLHGDEEIGTKKIKLASKISALKELGKHFNIYADHERESRDIINIKIEGKDAQL